MNYGKIAITAILASTITIVAWEKGRNFAESKNIDLTALEEERTNPNLEEIRRTLVLLEQDIAIIVELANAEKQSTKIEKPNTEEERLQLIALAKNEHDVLIKNYENEYEKSLREYERVEHSYSVDNWGRLTDVEKAKEKVEELSNKIEETHLEYKKRLFELNKQ